VGLLEGVFEFFDARRKGSKLAIYGVYVIRDLPRNSGRYV
jgi:hypothetical protein